MKKSIKKIDNQKQKILKTLGIIMLAFLCFQISNTYATNGILHPILPKIHKKTSNINPVYVYNELLNNIKSGKICYSVKVSSVSVKNNNYAFSSFAKGFLEIKNDHNIAIPGLITEFDDRKNFQGTKTRENVEMYYASYNKIGVVVNMQTWGNKSVKLKNVKITKERYGYFITGNINDGNRTVYYTFGIYKTSCLI